MKNKIKFLGMVALVAIIGFAVSCGDGGNNGTSNNGGDPQPFIAMVQIPATSPTFTMGLEVFFTPIRQITLSSFSMSKYQVTQAQYQEVMGTNPSYFNGTAGREADSGEVQSRRPIERVTWYDAIEFCNKLSVKEELTPVYTIEGRSPPSGYPIISATVTPNWSANGYRLPTEAQWEYACRAGSTTQWHFGDVEGTDNTGLRGYAWYTVNSNSKTHEVGKKLPNAFGLYDMHGNVWEWCWDWLGTYDAEDTTNPLGASSSTQRVIRGGSLNSIAMNSRSAHRFAGLPDTNDGDRGFRVVLP